MKKSLIKCCMLVLGVASALTSFAMSLPASILAKVESSGSIADHGNCGSESCTHV